MALDEREFARANWKDRAEKAEAELNEAHAELSGKIYSAEASRLLDRLDIEYGGLLALEKERSERAEGDRDAWELRARVAEGVLAKDTYLGENAREKFEKIEVDLAATRDELVQALDRRGGEVDCDIGWAVKQLREECSVCRVGWNGKGQFLRLREQPTLEPNSLPYVYITTVQGERVPWLCSQTDLLACDWEVYHG